MKNKSKMQELIERMEKLFEFADSKARLKQKIEGRAEQIVEHIYKILMYGNFSEYKDTVHHWAAEIAGGMLKFTHKKLKGKNEVLSTEEMINSIKSKFIDSDEIVDIVYDCSRNYKGIDISKLDYDITYNKIFNCLQPLLEYCKSTKNPNLDIVIKIIEENK